MSKRAATRVGKLKSLIRVRMAAFQTDERTGGESSLPLTKDKRDSKSSLKVLGSSGDISMS